MGKVSSLPCGEKSKILSRNTYRLTRSKTRVRKTTRGLRITQEWMKYKYSYQGREWQLGQLCKLASAQSLKEIGSSPNLACRQIKHSSANLN